jgi:hypothetical protein
MRLLIIIAMLAVLGSLTLWQNHKSISLSSLFCAGVTAMIIIMIYFPNRKLVDFIRRLALTEGFKRARQK